MKGIAWVGRKILNRIFHQSWVYNFHASNMGKHIPGQGTNFLKGRRIWLGTAYTVSEELVAVKPRDKDGPLIKRHLHCVAWNCSLSNRIKKQGINVQIRGDIITVNSKLVAHGKNGVRDILSHTKLEQKYVKEDNRLSLVFIISM